MFLLGFRWWQFKNRHRDTFRFVCMMLKKRKEVFEEADFIKEEQLPRFTSFMEKVNLKKFKLESFINLPVHFFKATNFTDEELYGILHLGSQERCEILRKILDEKFSQFESTFTFIFYK